MTQDIHENKIPPETTNEINLADLIRQSWLKRRFILKVTGIFLLIGLFIALFSPVKYTAYCTVVPQSGKERSLGNLGGIAAMMGMNIGSLGMEEVLSPSVYPLIMKSVPFTREIMQTSIKVKKSEGKEINLYDYYTNSQYRPFNLIETIKKYTIGLPGVFGGRDDSHEQDDVSSDSVSFPVLSKKEAQVYKAIQKSLQLMHNQKEGYITISYSFPEAESSARLTDQIRKTLEKYVASFKSEKAEDNLAFVQQSFNDARIDFLEKQEKLASFQDANRKLTTASSRASEQQLKSEYDIALTIYNELAKQLEQAKIAVKETKPVLTVIEPVAIPVQKSAPKRSMIIIIFIFLGFVSGIGWILVNPLIYDLTQNVKYKR